MQYETDRMSNEDWMAKQWKKKKKLNRILYSVKEKKKNKFEM